MRSVTLCRFSKDKKYFASFLKLSFLAIFLFQSFSMFSTDSKNLSLMAPVIQGDFAVCPLAVETYNVESYDPTHTYVWFVSGAAYIDNMDGSITVSFPDAPGTIVGVNVFALDAGGNFLGVTFENVEIEEVIALACNDDLNLSLGLDCTVTITIDMILEGQVYPDESYTLELTDGFGHIIPGNVLDVSHIDMDITAKVIHDCSGNFCWGKVNLEDKNNPYLICDCPQGNQDPDCSFICTDLEGVLSGAVVLNPPIVGNGCTGYNLQFQDEVVEGVSCGMQTLERTWYVTNSQGDLTDYCLSEYQIFAITVDDILMPVEIVPVPCGEAPSPHEVVEEYDDPFTTDNGSTSTIENNEGIPYGFPYYLQNGHPQPLDNSVCDIYAVYSDNVIEVCAEECDNNSKVARNWTLLDWCTQEQKTFTQIIDSSDKEPPTISGPDITVSTSIWSCVAYVTPPTPTLLHDNCSDGEIDWWISGPPGWDDFGLEKSQDLDNDGVPDPYVFTYSATDCCGNIGTSTFNVTVVDLAPPTAIAKQNIVVSLTGAPGGFEAGTSKLYSSAVNNGSHDNCGLIKLEVRRPDGSPSCGSLGVGQYNNNISFNNNGQDNDDSRDTDGGHFVKFCCEDAMGFEDAGGQYGMHDVILRVYDDANMDGVAGTPGDNYNETWALVRVENKLPPLISCQNVTIECWEDHNDPDTVPIPVTTGLCESVGVTLINVIDQTDECGSGVIIKNWGVDMNNDGFVDGSTCSQIITLTPSSDTFDGNIQWPGDVTTGCVGDTEAQKPDWNEGVCDKIAWSYTDELFNIVPDACWKVLRHYTVLNWCTGEEWTHTQVLKYLDDERPEIVCEDRMIAADAIGAGGTVLCGSHLNITKTVTDPGNCPSGIFDWYVTVDLWENGINDWIFTTSQAAYASNTDNILPLPREATITLIVPDPVDASCANHRIDYTVDDGCNNSVSCTEHFMVVDKKAPTPYCVNVSTAVMDNGQVTLWANDFDLGGFDDCSPQEELMFTFGPDLPPSGSPLWNPEETSTSRTFTCADADADGNVNLDIYIWDNSCTPNSDHCNVTVKLSDCVAPPVNRVVAGFIATESGDEVSNVDVILDSDAIVNYPIYDVTDIDGAYAFLNTPVGFDYTIEGRKNDDWMNGVSTLDLLLIQKHILGQEDLDSPYKMIAADINRNNAISAIDLVELRKLILGIYVELPNNNSWRFIKAAQVMEMNDPFSFQEGIEIQDLQNVRLDENFIGIKIGDVNGNVSANINSNLTSNRSDKSLKLIIDDQAFNENETFLVNVYADDFNDISGFQFTLSHPGLKLEGITQGAIEMNNSHFASVQEFATTVSWNATEQISIDNNDVLFTLKFVALNEGEILRSLKLNGSLTSAEAYKGSAYEVMDVEMTSRESVVTDRSLVLLQNKPNPFNESTSIKFYTDLEEDAVFTLLDIAGRVLKTERGSFNVGWNEIILSKDDINEAGLLYYKIEAGNEMAIKKMILIK